MAKSPVLGAILTTVGVVAQFVPIPGAAFAGKLLIYAGLSILSDSLFGLPHIGNGSKIAVTSTQGALPVIYGTHRVSHFVADYQTHGTNNSWLSVMSAVCLAGESGKGIDGITNIYLYEDETSATNPLNENTATAGQTQGKIAKYYRDPQHFWVYSIGTGADTQAVDAWMEDKYPDAWGSANTYGLTRQEGRGLVTVMNAFLWDKEEEDNIWAKGRPDQNITYKLNGALLYDPRWKTEGPDIDGWIWDRADNTNLISTDNHPGQNPALQILDYLTSKRYGMGVPYNSRGATWGPEDEIDEQSFIDMAEHCDEPVTTTGLSPNVTRPRYTANAVISTADTHKSNLERLLSSCNAMLVYEGGLFKLIPRKVTTAETYEITESEIIGDISVVREGASVANMITVRWPEAEQRWNIREFTWPYDAYDDTQNGFLKADNSVPNHRTIDLPAVTDYIHAQWLAMTYLKELREDTLIEVKCRESAIQLSVGDVVNVTYDSAGWSQKPFWVIGMEVLSDSTLNIQLKEYASSVYSLDPNETLATTPDTNLTDPFSVTAPTAVTSDCTKGYYLNDGTYIPRVEITWTHSTDEFAHEEELVYKKNSDSEWTFTGIKKKIADTAILHWEGDIELGVSYDFGIVAWNNLGNRSAIAADPSPCTPSASIDPPSTDLIWNNDFELQGGYWYKDGGSGTASIESGGLISGTYSLKIISHVSTDTGVRQDTSPNAALNVTNKKLWIPVSENETYVLHGRGYVSATGVPGRVRVEFVDEEKASPVYTDVLDFSTYISPTYAKGYFKVPAGKFYMAIWCYAMTDASAPRDFHIDDLRLIKRLFKLPTPIAQVDAAQDGSTKIRWSGDEVESVRYSTSTVSMPSAPTGGSGGDGIDSTGTFAGDTIGFEGIEYVALVGYSNTDGTGVEAEPVFLEIEKSAPDDTDDLTQGTVRKVVDAKYLDADAKPEKLVIQPDQGRTHLVLNADAEVGDPLTLGVPPYWGNDGGSTYLALESVSPISGDYSLKLSAAAAADQGFWPVLAYEGDRGATATDATEMPLLPVEEGDILRLLLTAKSDGTAGSDLRAYVRKWGPDKTHIGTAFFVQSDTTDLKWTPADTTAIARWGSYTVPSGTAFVNIELNVLKPTSGTAVWLADDLYLRRYVPLDQEVYGDLPAGTGLADSGAVRPLARGRQSGQDQDTDSVTFSPAFADPPLVLIKPGMSHQPVNAEWSSASYDTAKATYVDMSALNLTTSGFTLRARLRQKATGSPTLRFAHFLAGDNITNLNWTTKNADTDMGTNVPSSDDTYEVSYDVYIKLKCPDSGKPDRTAWIDVAIWTQHDAAGWVERRVDRYTHSASYVDCSDSPTAGYDDKTWSDETHEISVSGLDANDDVRITVKAISGGGFGVGESFDVNPHASGDATPYGVAWYTATDSFATMTPDTEDLISWEALAIV